MGRRFAVDTDGWQRVSTGESRDLVFRRDDGAVYAKVATGQRRDELAGERDRLLWLCEQGVSCPEVVDWREDGHAAQLVMTAVPGVAASVLTGEDLLRAWPSMARQLTQLHDLPLAGCPFDRSLLRMLERARDVVSRLAVNRDFLSDEDRDVPQTELLERIRHQIPERLIDEDRDKVVCHGDPCLPNFMVDPGSFACTGLIDLGRLGVADRYADLALMTANAEENWTEASQSRRASGILFSNLQIARPDTGRLRFYLRLDPLTWG